MSERYELSFKNKEVRMYVYLVVPTLIIASILIFYGEQNYHFIPLLAFLIIFYVWRYFYRRKRKKEGEKSS
ncbi:hypothetical protein [Sporosarcina luteola]|uniref:hypothetical protein n=1 Tax=Sporosarcina luteola TaxID=582850 RepID=UPI00203B440B|nr:hypothetical protein [Sporosarcina luteola]MCM3711755.1 hypothetical protein [Sporosarcina luteola]